MKGCPLVLVLGIFQVMAIAQAVHPLAEKRFERGLLDADTDLHITLHLRGIPERQAALERLLEEQSDPASPNYHRWLTPEEFGDQFGASEADVEGVSEWLRTHGLKVHGAARGRQWISAGGRAGQIAALLGTEIRRYERDGKVHYANATAARIPAEISRMVQGIVSLDDFDAEPAHRRGAVPDFNGVGGNHFLAPEDVATIYNLGPLYQAGIDGSGRFVNTGVSPTFAEHI
jgi:subtilase family serine protease